MILKILFFFIAFVGCVTPSMSQISKLLSCPVSSDLDHGIIVTSPAGRGEIVRRYRRLEGSYIGVSYVNGIFPSGTTVSYSGLFTYKHWRGGRIIQYEEPKTNLTELLKFEVGSSHLYESVRYNPRLPDRKWFVSTKYRIEAAADFNIGGCSYASVQISREGTIMLPGRKVRRDREVYIFVPELLLRVSGTGMRWGSISSVRKRTILDGRGWPFSQDAASVLRD